DVRYQDGTEKPGSVSSDRAQDRCDPYTYWYTLNQMCQRDPSIESVRWTFDHSVNGGPFYRIVDVPNACALTYKPFGHNAWIITPAQGAKVVGYPGKNLF